MENRLKIMRFLGRHRCPQCRMPLHAEELTCPVCDLAIVFVNSAGEVMVQMVVLDDLNDWRNEDVREYHTMQTVEATGEMYMPRRYLPIRPQRADLVVLPDGALGVRYTNLVRLEDIHRIG